jgi:tetratricopeptide (TPR) repeat protein
LYAFRLNNPDSAFFYIEKGIELAQKYDTNSLIELYLSLGKLYSKQNNLQKSIDAYNKSLNTAVSNDDLNGQMEAHLHLSDANKALKNFATALNHYENYTILNDSINTKETKTQISRLNEKYENDKNKLLIEQLTIQQQHDQLVQIALITGILLLIVALLLILYGLVQRKKRTRMEKSILENEVQFKNKELASHALMMMQENKMLQTLYNSISEAAKANTDELPRILNSLKMQIKSSFKSEKDWEHFKLYF